MNVGPCTLVPKFSCSDETVAAARDGSAAAFEILVLQYYAPVDAYILHIVHDAEAASELTQDVFTIVLEKSEQLSDLHNFRSWLFSIAHNVAASYMRRRKAIGLWSLDGLGERLASFLAARNRQSDFDRVVLRDAIRDALNCLSSSEREAVLLHSVAGLDTNEIAEVMGISPAAAGRRISRGKEHFRHIYVDAVDD